MELQQEGLESRRSLLARSVEFASAAPLVGLIFTNFNTRTSYYEIDGSQARYNSVPLGVSSDLSRVNSSLDRVIADLQKEYKSAYYKRHTRLVPHKVGKTTTLRTQVYYVWEEPANVPDHSVIDSWSRNHLDFSNRINLLPEKAKLDLEKLDALKVKMQITNQGSEGLVSLALYTPQIAALLFYEEAIAKLKHGGYSNHSASKLVEIHDTAPQITRRSFFKAAAAFTGAVVSAPIVAGNRNARTAGKSKLESDISSATAFAKAQNGKAFAEYIGADSVATAQRYSSQIALAKNTLGNGVKELGVRTAFQNYISTAEIHEEGIRRILGAGAPDELVTLMKSAIISENLKESSSAEHFAVYTGLGLNALVVAGTIIGTLLPAEILNEKFSNRPKED